MICASDTRWISSTAQRSVHYIKLVCVLLAISVLIYYTSQYNSRHVNNLFTKKYVSIHNYVYNNKLTTDREDMNKKFIKQVPIEEYNNKHSHSESTLKIDVNKSYYEKKMEDNVSPCTSEKQYVYFLKAHKTGSTTARNILQRFVMKRNLTMPVFMRQHTYPSRSLTEYLRSIPTYWKVYQQLKTTGKSISTTLKQYLMNLPEHLKVRDNQCNILAVHTVFVKEQAMKLFPLSVKFISTLRHPLYQMISSFSHWNLARRLDIPDGGNPIEEFLRNPRKYDHFLPASLYNPIAKIEKLTLSFTRNYIAYEFGFDLDRVEYDKVYVKEYLEELNKTFSVIIFTDLFTESLILLKRELCWAFKDILFIHLRKRSDSSDSPSNSDKLLENHRKWTYLDYQIYDMFRSRHKHLVKQGEQLFQEELAAFESVLAEVTDFCKNKIAVAIRHHGNDISGLKRIARINKIINRTRFSGEFAVEGSDCVLMSINENKMWVAARVQKYPHLCDKQFSQFISKFEIEGSSRSYCLEDSERMKYNIPYELMKEAFWKT